VTEGTTRYRTGTAFRRESREPPTIRALSRHLLVHVAVADAGTFTTAEERIFIAQGRPQQADRTAVEEMVGTQLMHRGRGGGQITEAGA